MISTYSGRIIKLKSDQIFVFGSNLRGFHGAGSAGYASFNVLGNQWRNFGYDKNPTGWKGNGMLKVRLKVYKQALLEHPMLYPQ